MFNPSDRIQRLQANTGYSMILNYDINEIIQENRRLRFISNAVLPAIGCAICGLIDATRKLLVFAESLHNDLGMDKEKDHLDTRDYLGPFAFHAAIFTWLMYQKVDSKYANMYIEATRKEDQNSSRPDAAYLRLVVPKCYTIGEYEYGIYLFEKHSKKKEMPKNFLTKNSGMLAYMLCKQKLGQLPDIDLALSVKKYLDMELGDAILGHGHYEEAATWLKIAYWDGIENPPTPGEVLLKAYDHMSSVTKPFRLKAFDV